MGVAEIEEGKARINGDRRRKNILQTYLLLILMGNMDVIFKVCYTLSVCKYIKT